MPPNDEADQVTQDPSDDAGASSRPLGKPRGLRGRLLGSLEGYLTRAATDLDERGEQLRRRSADLDRRAAEVEAAEAKVAEREQRLAALGLSGRGQEEQIDRVLSEVAERDAARRAEAAEVARLRAELERRAAELAARTAETTEHAQRLAESEDERARLGERLAAAERDLVAMVATLEERDRRLAQLEVVHERELDRLLSRLSDRDRALADAQLALEIARASLTGREGATPARPAGEAAEPSDRPLRERGPERREPVRAAYSAARDRRASGHGDAEAAGRERPPEPGETDAPLRESADDDERGGDSAVSGDGGRTEPAHAAAARHLLFVPTPTRYTLVEREGPAPSPGEDVEADEGRFRVSRVAASPLPGDTRRCAYLQAIG